MSAEDLTNLRILVTDFRRCMDGEITVETVQEKLRRLPGHPELKETIFELFLPHDDVLLSQRVACSFAIGHIQHKIVGIMNQMQPDRAIVPIAVVDPDTDWERMDSDELADRTTDEESDEDGPPIARRIDYSRIRL